MECPHCGKEITQAEVDEAMHNLESAGKDLERIMAFIKEAIPEIDAAFERIRQHKLAVSQLHSQSIVRLNGWSKN